MDYGGSNGTHSNPKPSPSKQKRAKFILDSTNQDSSDALSSSTSSCDSDDLFQVNPQILVKLGAQDKPPHPAGPTKPFYENDEIDLSNVSSPGSASLFSDITHESLIPIQFLPTQSPPAQIMLRPIGFDPDRIPPSAFSKSSTPTEWSAASNDSLFSIRIGGTSFSRDHICRVEPELTEQGGLLPSPKRSGEIIGFGSYSQDSKCIEPYVDIEKTADEDVKIEGVLVMNTDEDSKQNEPKVSVINEVDRVKREPTGDLCGPHQLPEKCQVRIEYFIKATKNKSSSRGICHCCGCKLLSCSFCRSFKWWCFSFLKWPSCHCKCSNFWNCCCKCSSCSCSHCSSWSCFKCSSWFCCNCSSWPCFNCSSCSCFKCSPWCCCDCSYQPCFKRSSWTCFKRSSWSCCNCRCSNCTWACCYCRKCELRTSSCDSQAIFSDTTSKSPRKPTSRSKCSGFPCSCCCCWSCSCCC